MKCKYEIFKTEFQTEKSSNIEIRINYVFDDNIKHNIWGEGKRDRERDIKREK